MFYYVIIRYKERSMHIVKQKQSNLYGMAYLSFTGYTLYALHQAYEKQGFVAHMPICDLTVCSK